MIRATSLLWAAWFIHPKCLTCAYAKNQTHLSQEPWKLVLQSVRSYWDAEKHSPAWSLCLTRKSQYTSYCQVIAVLMYFCCMPSTCVQMSFPYRSVQFYSLTVAEYESECSTDSNAWHFCARMALLKLPIGNHGRSSWALSHFTADAQLSHVYISSEVLTFYSRSSWILFEPAEGCFAFCDISCDFLGIYCLAAASCLFDVWLRLWQSLQLGAGCPVCTNTLCNDPFVRLQTARQHVPVKVWTQG